MVFKERMQTVIFIIACFFCAGLMADFPSFKMPDWSISYPAPGYRHFLEDSSFLSSLEGNRLPSNATPRVFLLSFSSSCPPSWVVLSCSCGYRVFYNLKIRRSLALLQEGAERICRQDLDCHEPVSGDELGCSALLRGHAFGIKNQQADTLAAMEEQKG